MQSNYNSYFNLVEWLAGSFDQWNQVTEVTTYFPGTVWGGRPGFAKRVPSAPSRKERSLHPAF